MKLLCTCEDIESSWKDAIQEDKLKNLVEYGESYLRLMESEVESLKLYETFKGTLPLRILEVKMRVNGMSYCFLKREVLMLDVHVKEAVIMKTKKINNQAANVQYWIESPERERFEQFVRREFEIGERDWYPIRVLFLDALKEIENIYLVQKKGMEIM